MNGYRYYMRIKAKMYLLFFLNQNRLRLQLMRFCATSVPLPTKQHRDCRDCVPNDQRNQDIHSPVQEFIRLITSKEAC